jgi:hypothetical protein
LEICVMGMKFADSTHGVKIAGILFLLGISLIVGGLAGCSRASASAATHAASTGQSPTAEVVSYDPPSSLVQVGESAENVFDSARSGAWPTAEVRLHALRQAAEALPEQLPKPDLVSRLHVQLASLEQRVAEKEQIGAMEDANGITRLAAELAAQYRTTVPYEIVMLDYYGRQLEVGIAAGNQATLTRASADLRQAWNQVEPTNLRRVHVEDAKQFTAIVVNLERARRPADFVAPTRAELDAVDRLEAIFAPAK